MQEQDVLLYQQLSSLTWERLRSSRIREYKRAIWEMRKIREQLGKRERGRTINYIIASPSLASLWVQRKHNIFLGLYKVTNEGLAET